MKYSYIKPRAKSALTPELKLIFTFFSMAFLMLVLTYTFLLFKEYRFSQDINAINEENITIDKALAQMKNKITFIKTEDVFTQSIQTKNLVLKDSITNLFDLVPGRITLSQAKLDKNSLILYGVTPNKDVYNFMLQAPLRSIFHRTYSSFYPLENGWLNFVSTNYTDEEEVVPQKELENED